MENIIMITRSQIVNINRRGGATVEIKTTDGFSNAYVFLSHRQVNALLRVGHMHGVMVGKHLPNAPEITFNFLKTRIMSAEERAFAKQIRQIRKEMKENNRPVPARY